MVFPRLFLYDKVYRPDILSHAYNLVKANKGAPGADGETFERIEEREGGANGYLGAIAGELKRKEYKPQPACRVYIPKASGGKRPLGIPTIKDRVVQMAVKIIIEPIFAKPTFRKTLTGSARNGTPIRLWTHQDPAADGEHKSGG